jgi:hypothetical protein
MELLPFRLCGARLQISLQKGAGASWEPREGAAHLFAGQFEPHRSLRYSLLFSGRRGPGRQRHCWCLEILHSVQDDTWERCHCWCLEVLHSVQDDTWELWSLSLRGPRRATCRMQKDRRLVSYLFRGLLQFKGLSPTAVRLLLKAPAESEPL